MVPFTGSYCNSAAVEAAAEAGLVGELKDLREENSKQFYWMMEQYHWFSMIQMCIITTSAEYTTNDRLTSVTLDDGTAATYTYANGVLDSIVRSSLL